MLVRGEPLLRDVPLTLLGLPLPGSRLLGTILYDTVNIPYYTHLQLKWVEAIGQPYDYRI